MANTLYLVGGNVGIGTAAPARALHIAAPNTSPQFAIGTDNNTAYNFQIQWTSANTASLQALAGGVGSNILLNAAGGNVGIGTVSPAYSLDVSKGVGLTGTARFFDQTATTGATLVTITPGASQTANSTVLDVKALARFGGTNSTAAVAGLIGTTCPAVTCTAAYTWVKAIAADNSVVYFPVWK